MSRRQNLNDGFKRILGNENVYFQPPETVKIKYDAIIYKLSDLDVTYADNIKYKMMNCYEVVLLTKDPTSDKVKKMLDTFYNIRFIRYYASNNLNHYVYKLYY